EGDEAAAVRSWIDAELAHCARTAAARLDLGEGPEVALVARALDRLLEEARGHLLLLLSFLYAPETMRRVRGILESGSAESRAYAIELVDTVLPIELRDRIRPVIDDLGPAERLAALDPREPRLDRETRPRALTDGDAP